VIPEIDRLSLDQLLPGQLAYVPGMDLETLAKAAPARWVVYLMSDESDRPVQLLCVKNLRQSLRRRLGGEETLVPGASKRVDYRQLVRRISFVGVDSPLEADWVYYEAARRVFPDTYQAMVGFRPAWFVHVDPDARFPRYTKTTELAGRKGELIGPLEDKHAAARLIELVEDAFDLCRYYNVLIQSPRGSACAYKEMGKCPAPCDGSISMDQYRWMVRWSAATIVNPEPFVREQALRMEQAAAELRFETAGKIKAFVTQLSELGKRGLRAARRLEDFRYVSIQPGGRSKCAKVFLIWPGGIEIIACVRGLALSPSPCTQGEGRGGGSALASPSSEPTGPTPTLTLPLSTGRGDRNGIAELLRLVTERMESHKGESLDAIGVERIGIVSQHLFTSKGSGVFVGMDRVDEATLSKAIDQVIRRKEPAESETQDEGVMRELASME